MYADVCAYAPMASIFRYEYNAVRYAVERMDAAAAAAANGGGGSNNGADVELTMVSLGGASLQMASATAVVSATAGMRQVIANEKAAAFKTLLKDAYASVDGAAAGVDVAQKVVEEWSEMITAALSVGRQALRQDGSKLSVRNLSVWDTCFARPPRAPHRIRWQCWAAFVASRHFFLSSERSFFSSICLLFVFVFLFWFGSFLRNIRSTDGRACIYCGTRHAARDALCNRGVLLVYLPLFGQQKIAGLLKD